MNRGHRAECNPYDDEALNGVLKPFIVIKGSNVSAKALEDY